MMHSPTQIRAASPLRLLRLALLCALALLSGCGAVGPAYRAPEPLAPARWHAPMLAHDGDPAVLTQWWKRFDDETLTALIDAAQRESATLAQAWARIEQARAAAITAGVASDPGVEFTLKGDRSAFSFGGPAQRRTLMQLGPQASWEIDLAGGLKRNREATTAAYQSTQAAWHDARVSVAAEVANLYLRLRHCEAQVALTREDLQTRRDSARIHDAAVTAGLQPATAAFNARAAAAQAADALEARLAQCESAVKALAALSAIDEPALRERLEPARGRIPRAAQFSLEAMPARAIAQRPDIVMAERELAAASARIGVLQASRYPSLSLTGNILPSLASLNGSALNSVMTWVVAPALSVPLLDGGRRGAHIEAARAQYEALDSALRARVRGAAREVEDALVGLNAAAAREREAGRAVAELQSMLNATQARVKTGLGSHLDLLDARRAVLAARSSLVQARELQAESWIALYRAMGGGWDGVLAVTPATRPAAPPQPAT